MQLLKPNANAHYGAKHITATREPRVWLSFPGLGRYGARSAGVPFVVIEGSEVQGLGLASAV